jgi:putative aldouronate transport system permease protein
MRKFFQGIPESLKESAEIDGAGPLTILVKIYLPLATPALATIGLMYAVGRWNGFTDALMFMQGPGADRWHPIQLLLFNILQGTQGVDTTLDPGAAAAPGRGQTVQAAAIVVAMVPILMVYPWLQKYFVSGVTLGAVKG